MDGMEEPKQEPAGEVKLEPKVESEVEPKVEPKVEPEGTSGMEEAAAVDKGVVMAKLREILPTVDLDITTEKMLRKQLEAVFKTDLTHLKSDIRKEIESWMDAQQPVKEEEDEEDEQGEAAPKRKAKGGFGKLCKLSPVLAEFLEVESESRAQVVKKIWDYIKLHDLQDPKDRRKIKPDAKLSKIFPKNVTMFTMNKVLNKHFLSDDGSTASKSRKKKRDDEDEDEDDDDEEEDDDDDYKAAKPAKKVAKTSKSGGGGGGGFTKDLKLSSDLAALVGVPEMSRPQLQKFFTNYFKENNLLKPSDKRVVVCNDKLKALFQVDEFIAFGQIQKLLKPHLS